MCSLAVPAQLPAKTACVLLVAGDNGDRVVAGDAAHHIGQTHRVERRARRVGKAGQRFEHHHDARAVCAHTAFVQDQLEPLRVVDVVGLVRNSIAAASAAERLFVKIQLLDVTRDGRLLALDAAFGQVSNQLLLCLNVVLGDQLKYFLLPLALHDLLSHFPRPDARRSGFLLFFPLSLSGLFSARPGSYRSSRLTGQDMQRGPPRPRDSSADGMEMTSMPFLSSSSLVT